MFNSEAFRKGDGDPYKMVRHTMRLVDISALALEALGDQDEAITMSQGCKSNKDRGGMADVENKAQAIIEDMGGKVTPGGTFDDQDQAIYNTVLTSSGQDDVQKLMTGLPGSKNAHEAGGRIVDPSAIRYASAYSKHTSA